MILLYYPGGLIPTDSVTNKKTYSFITTGNEWERLTTESKESFSMTSFVITNQSDRMGYRLNNIPLCR